MFILKSVSTEVKPMQEVFMQQSKAKKMVLYALLTCIAAVLQAAGGIIPGAGYLISPLATAPILLCTMLSLSFGVTAYFLTILVLLILQPSELIVFPFTTGLLGLGTGAAFFYFNKKICIVLSGATLLTMGIISLLYLFHFPVLGPAVSDSFSFVTLSLIFLFAYFYSWIWVEVGMIIFKRLKKIIFR